MQLCVQLNGSSPDVLRDRSPAIFGEVLSGAFQMFTSVFQNTWRDNGTQSVLSCDYASCFPSLAFFNPIGVIVQIS